MLRFFRISSEQKKIGIKVFAQSRTNKFSNKIILLSKISEELKKVFGNLLTNFFVEKNRFLGAKLVVNDRLKKLPMIRVLIAVLMVILLKLIWCASGSVCQGQASSFDLHFSKNGRFNV